MTELPIRSTSQDREIDSNGEVQNRVQIIFCGLVPKGVPKNDAECDILQTTKGITLIVKNVEYNRMAMRINNKN